MSLIYFIKSRELLPVKRVKVLKHALSHIGKDFSHVCFLPHTVTLNMTTHAVVVINRQRNTQHIQCHSFIVSYSEEQWKLHSLASVSYLPPVFSLLCTGCLTAFLLLVAAFCHLAHKLEKVLEVAVSITLLSLALFTTGSHFSLENTWLDQQ